MFPAATALPRSERSAKSTPAPSLQASNSSSLSGNIPVLLHQQGRDGRDGRDGLQGPVGPSGKKGEKGDQGIPLQGADGQQGPERGRREIKEYSFKGLLACKVGT